MQQLTHQFTSIDGLNLFYREAGPDTDAEGAPTILLLHGSPSSSIAFRYMLADLSDRWRLIAPDLPGFGLTQSAGNPSYSFTFDNLAATIGRFIEKLQLKICGVYLHDYGAQVGFRLLTGGVIRPQATIIQNSEAYRGLGWRDPMWAVEKRLAMPSEEARSRLLRNLLNKDGIQKEFVEELATAIAIRIDPAVTELAWSKLQTPDAMTAMLELLMDYGSNLQHYPKIQEWLRAQSLPTLLLWGEADQYLSPEAAHAYLRDVPNAEVKFYDGGHWLLESHVREVNTATRKFFASHIV